MRSWLTAIAVAAIAVLAAAAPALAQDGEEQIPSIELRDALTPASADWVGHSLEQAEADWEYMIDLNLKGTAWTCRAVAPVMARAGHGRIVNITSIGAEFGLVNRAAYCATKGAVAQLTRCLALEWGRHGITVNAVGPGITVTPLVRPFLDANPGKEQTMIRKIPLGRLGRPSDMAGAVAFLASDLAEYITGQTIYVDGGWGVGDLDW